MNKKRTITLCCIILALLCFITSMMAGCESSSDGYKELCVDKGIAHFSFEYPANWKVKDIEIEDNYIDILIAAPYLVREDKDNKYIRSTIWSFFIMMPNGEHPDAKTVANNELIFWKERFDAKILEFSTIELYGVIADKFVISYGAAVEYPWEEPEPTIHKEIYLDHDGLIWNIAAISNQEVVDKDDIHFLHMLETFKFLD